MQAYLPGKAATRVSPRLLSLFLAYMGWYVPRHFHALRVAHVDRFPQDARPLIVCINHASWWDPLVILMLTRYLEPARFAYAPMEADALMQYGFFRKIGAFPVNNHSPFAGLQFLRQARDILSQPEAILWMTPEGRFTDVRQRPVDWKSGTAAITGLLASCTVVPLALEYTFWNERLPEVLCSIGEPILFAARDGGSTAERGARLQQAMTVTQDELMTRALKRDGALFTTVFGGNAGVSVLYDAWRRMKAMLGGKPYIPDHSAIAPK